MPTCSYCGHDVGANAKFCPSCGEAGEYWKDYGPDIYSKSQAAWSELFAPIFVCLFIAGFGFLFVRFGLPILVGIAAFLFSNPSKVKWDVVDNVSVGAAWIVAILMVLYAIKEGEFRGYLNSLPQNAARVLRDVAIVVGAIGGLYLLFVISGHVFFR